MEICRFTKSLRTGVEGSAACSAMRTDIFVGVKWTKIIVRWVFISLFTRISLPVLQRILIWEMRLEAKPLPQMAHPTFHCLARLHRLPGDMIDHDIILEPISPSLVAAHSGADLLPTEIVLDSL